MSQLWQDMRYAFRTILGAPGFAAVAILTLAVGIGANAAIFSFVNGILLNPLPYPTADRIVRVLEKPPGAPTARNGISTLNYLDWEKQNDVFDRTGRSSRVNAIYQHDPVQRPSARSCDAGVGRSGAGGSRAVGLLYSGAAGNESGSDGGPAIRIALLCWPR